MPASALGSVYPWVPQFYYLYLLSLADCEDSIHTYDCLEWPSTHLVFSVGYHHHPYHPRHHYCNVGRDYFSDIKLTKNVD